MIGIDKAVGHDITAFFELESKPKVLTLSLNHKWFDPIKAGVKNPKIRIGAGKPEWGAEPGKRYFVITWEDA